MWRFVLTLSLFCWGCDGAVTCRNENNAEVNWFVLYKAPRLTGEGLTGLEYVYIDSGGARNMVPSNQNYKSIKHTGGVLANTLRHIFTPIRNMPNNFGFISYSDQPPGCSTAEKFGHSKGVLMMDNSVGGKGVWLLHSTPQFPFRRHQDHFWPRSGESNAQTFICVTFLYTEFDKIGLHLQEIGAFPFEHDLPETFHQTLKDAVIWKQSPPQNNFKVLISTDSTQKFSSIAKQQVPETAQSIAVGDLYFTIASNLGSDLQVQTWGCQPGRKPSYCVPGFHKLLNVKNIWTPLGTWEPKNDHSKWCVTQNQNKNWVCIADMNRSKTQYQRRGGALCFENTVVKNWFLRFSQSMEGCSDPNIMDMSGCDTDTDSDTDTIPALMG